MKEININSSFYVYHSIEELSTEVQSLIKKALEIKKKAYAPYSKFKVGAAILLENGETVLGSNQENAAYPSGLCAERVAVFQAGTLYPDTKILKLVITASSEISGTTTPTPPCGACRQSIAEYEHKQKTPIEIYFMGETDEVYMSKSIYNLLPLCFDKTSL